MAWYGSTSAGREYELGRGRVRAEAGAMSDALAPGLQRVESGGSRLAAGEEATNPVSPRYRTLPTDRASDGSARAEDRVGQARTPALQGLHVVRVGPGGRNWPSMRHLPAAARERRSLVRRRELARLGRRPSCRPTGQLGAHFCHARLPSTTRRPRDPARCLCGTGRRRSCAS